MNAEIGSLQPEQIHGLFLQTLQGLSTRPPEARSSFQGLGGKDKRLRIEHTQLRSDASAADIARLCAEASAFRFRGICVHPRDVAHCVSLLHGTAVRVIAVVDFPLGCGGIEDVSAQAGRMIAIGATEVDMVLDVRAIRCGALADAAARIRAVVEATSFAPVKVILETGYLSETEIVAACAVAASAGAAFVKTSTGYGPRGASIRDIEIMRAAVGDSMGIKASGGIRDHAWADALIAAGADVIGTSNGPACLDP